MKVSKGDAVVRVPGAAYLVLYPHVGIPPAIPKCNWATRSTKIESAETKRRRVRMAAGPIGNQNQSTAAVSTLKRSCGWVFELLVDDQSPTYTASA